MIALLATLLSAPCEAATFQASAELNCPLAGELSQILPLPGGDLLDALDDWADRTGQLD